MFPAWFNVISIVGLLGGLISAIVIAIHVVRHPQQMSIMNIVWPVTALFGTLLVVIAYFRYGLLNAKDTHKTNQDKAPFPVMVTKGALHCGSGCMIGDIFAEWLAFLIPTVAVWFGWHSIFSDKMYAVWVLDFVFAFVLGIVFQYFAIMPMRKLSLGAALVAAVKADTLSLAAWQIGMYGFMAFAQLYVFAVLFGKRAEVDTPEFWFAMQLAMLAGFVTAYPINWWLIRVGIKEKM